MGFERKVSCLAQNTMTSIGMRCLDFGTLPSGGPLAGINGGVIRTAPGARCARLGADIIASVQSPDEPGLRNGWVPAANGKVSSIARPFGPRRL